MPAKAKPPQYGPTTDLRDFVLQFDRYLILSNTGNDAAKLQHLSVALPTHLFKILNMEMESDPDGSFAAVTERFLLAAGSPPRDAASEQAAFESATIAKGETMAAFAGRLSMMAITAHATFTADVRNVLVLRRFINALSSTHPHIYRALETCKPKTIAEAIEVAAVQVRVDETVSAIAAPSTSAPSIAASTPSASSTTIVASSSTTSANAAASETSLADKMNDVLKHLRAIRSGPSRGGYNRPQSNFQRYQPRFEGPCNNCGRCNSQQQQSFNPPQQGQQQRPPFPSQRFSRPSSAPPRNLQCWKCGDNHYSRDCPNGQWPGHN
jgi:hypothetical protein